MMKFADQWAFTVLELLYKRQEPLITVECDEKELIAQNFDRLEKRGVLYKMDSEMDAAQLRLWLCSMSLLLSYLHQDEKDIDMLKKIHVFLMSFPKLGKLYTSVLVELRTQILILSLFSGKPVNTLMEWFVRHSNPQVNENLYIRFHQLQPLLSNVHLPSVKERVIELYPMINFKSALVNFLANESHGVNSENPPEIFRQL